MPNGLPGQMLVIATFPWAFTEMPARLEPGEKMIGLFLNLPLWRPRSIRVSRFLLTCVQEELLVGRTTLDCLWRHIVWACNVLHDGRWPHTGPNGEPMPIPSTTTSWSIYSSKSLLLGNGGPWGLGLVQTNFCFPKFMEGRCSITCLFSMWSPLKWTISLLRCGRRFTRFGQLNIKIWQNSWWSKCLPTPAAQHVCTKYFFVFWHGSLLKLSQPDNWYSAQTEAQWLLCEISTWGWYDFAPCMSSTLGSHTELTDQPCTLLARMHV